jgi:sugar phosphate isomerase/epimerase
MFKCLSPAALGLSATVNELIEPALSFGFKGFELDIKAFAAQAEREGLATSRRLIDSAKLKFGYFQLPTSLDAEDAAHQVGLAQLAKQAELAAQLGCTRAVTTLPAADHRPIHQNFDFQRKRIGEVAKVLEAHGVQLGLGFCATADAPADGDFEFVRGFDTLKMLLAMVSAKNVGLAVDLFELWACGSSFEAVQQAKSKVVAVFVADVAAGVQIPDALQSSRVLPGETGAIDTAAALTALAETGYDGPVTPKPHPDRFKGVGRNNIFKTTGDKLDAAWKAAGLSPAGKLTAVKR